VGGTKEGKEKGVRPKVVIRFSGGRAGSEKGDGGNGPNKEKTPRCKGPVGGTVTGGAEKTTRVLISMMSEKKALTGTRKKIEEDSRIKRKTFHGPNNQQGDEQRKKSTINVQ